jgi:hypothetical protein
LTDDPVAPTLQAALVHSELTLAELWLRYFALGGTASAVEMTAYVQGLGDGGFDDAQHDVLVQSFNERFMEMDLDHPLPYHRP